MIFAAKQSIEEILMHSNIRHHFCTTIHLLTSCSCQGVRPDSQASFQDCVLRVAPVTSDMLYPVYSEPQTGTEFSESCKSQHWHSISTSRWHSSVNLERNRTTVFLKATEIVVNHSQFPVYSTNNLFTMLLQLRFTVILFVRLIWLFFSSLFINHYG